ncbi:phage tail sheath family protein [Secundilactobacillus muriivasis]
MAGGTWTAQNKVRPGAYINTKSVPNPKPDTSLGRTLLVGAAELNWGAKGVTELDSESDFLAALGTTLDDPKLRALKETLKGALTVLYLNNNDGEKAKVEDVALPWNFTAKYAGTQGNKVTISIEKDPDDETRITVTTLYGTKIVDQQTVRTITASGLESNAYVDVAFTGDGTEPVGTVTAADGGADFSATAGEDKLVALAASTTYPLAGGTTEAAEMTDLLNEALDTEAFQVVTTAGYEADNDIHELVATATKRLRENDGYKIRAVVPLLEGASKYDYEGVSVVTNGVVLNDGTTLTNSEAAGWFAGASSAAKLDESLTYAEYPDAIGIYPKFGNEQIIRELQAGHVVFTQRRDGTVVVEQDINSLITFTKEKQDEFHKNRTLRTMDGIAMDTSEIFHSQFIGKVDNNATGRDLFKANRVAYLRSLETAGAIQNFDPVDITVDPGEARDAILVNLAITPVDAMEKLYMTIYVN